MWHAELVEPRVDPRPEGRGLVVPSDPEPGRPRRPAASGEIRQRDRGVRAEDRPGRRSISLLICEKQHDLADTLTYAYDAGGRLTEMKDPGRVTVPIVVFAILGPCPTEATCCVR